MPTYYEILRVSPSATVSEIEAAYKTQWAQVQRLTTHSDPGTASKARQGLQFLEQVYFTLTDPARRAAYDASIGLNGFVGGPADPQAKPDLETGTPPPSLRTRLEAPDSNLASVGPTGRIAIAPTMGIDPDVVNEDIKDALDRGMSVWLPSVKKGFTTELSLSVGCD